jgi:hypothetical protein
MESALNRLAKFDFWRRRIRGPSRGANALAVIESARRANQHSAVSAINQE